MGLDFREERRYTKDMSEVVHDNKTYKVYGHDSATGMPVWIKSFADKKLAERHREEALKAKYSTGGWRYSDVWIENE